jgi:hypothetical protein
VTFSGDQLSSRSPSMEGSRTKCPDPFSPLGPLTTHIKQLEDHVVDREFSFDNSRRLGSES